MKIYDLLNCVWKSVELDFNKKEGLGLEVLLEKFAKRYKYNVLNFFFFLKKGGFEKIRPETHKPG